jgi:hypothetical protein
MAIFALSVLTFIILYGALMSTNGMVLWIGHTLGQLVIGIGFTVGGLS